MTMLQKLKQALVTMGCLLSYLVLPALLVGLILFLLAAAYSAFSLFFIFLSSL